MARKKAHAAASVRRSNRIASKGAVSYTPTTARVIKQSPAKKAPAKRSAAPKAAPVKKASVEKSAAPKKAPAIKIAPAPKQAPAKKVPISTTPSDSVPSHSKYVENLTASKKKTPSPKKSPAKNSPATASSKKSPKKVAVSDETDEDESIPTATGLGIPRRLK